MQLRSFRRWLASKILKFQAIYRSQKEWILGTLGDPVPSSTESLFLEQAEERDPFGAGASPMVNATLDKD
jgi:hypothetical protein